MVGQDREIRESLGVQMGGQGGKGHCSHKPLTLSSSTFFMERKYAAVLATVSKDCFVLFHPTKLSQRCARPDKFPHYRALFVTSE